MPRIPIVYDGPVKITQMPKSETDKLLKDALSFLQYIQRSHKGSIGTINNTYLPQLSINDVDRLATRIFKRLYGYG